MPVQTLYVAALPDSATNERLEEIFSEIGPIKQCFVVRKKGTDKCRGFGYVTYSMEEDAQRAIKEIKDYDGKRLSVVLAKKKIRDKKKSGPSAEPKEAEQKPKDFRTKRSKKSRLVIRNLSFKCTEDDLKEVFGKFGTVLEATIPLKPDGKMRGFAFVQLKTIFSAQKALKAMNLKEIKGRQVAVDWAVAKYKYVTVQQSSSSDATASKEAQAESDSDNDEEDTKQAPPEKKKAGFKAAMQQEEAQKSDEDDDEQESEDDDDNDEESENEDEEEGGSEDEDYGDSPDSNDDFDESEDEEENEDSQSALKKTPKKRLPSDVKEGRTLFIRNLSFDTDEEGLEEVLLRFGELNYVKIVLHPDTEHSKGCAFVQFKTKEAADHCIAVAQDEAENGGIRVNGRKLLIVTAVSRDDATKLKVDQKKVETGSRNLYLAREGLIRVGTKAAEGVSELDMIKRTRFEEVKRAKLRDISVFVSKTRLCIHNLPKSVDNKKLKALCLQALKGVKGTRITECRVMYDKKPEKGQATGQSLGYGFVQFRDHEQALSTLRYLNNNPDVFGPQKRPIVEFSLEDSRKLKLKEIRKQKHKDFLKNRSLKGEEKKSQISAEVKKPTGGGNKAQSEHTEEEKPNKKFSGFQTKPEVEHVDLQDGKKRRKVLPFPSHRGPKIRKRDKGKKQAPPVKNQRPGTKSNKQPRRQTEKPTQPRNQVKAARQQFRRRDGDRFESLVEQYKKKLMGNSSKNTIKTSKWFDN